MKPNPILFIIMLYALFTPLFAQQYYQKDGKILDVKDIVKHQEFEVAIKQIDSLIEVLPENLTKKEIIPFGSNKQF